VKGDWRSWFPGARVKITRSLHAQSRHRRNNDGTTVCRRSYHTHDPSCMRCPSSGGVDVSKGGSDWQVRGRHSVPNRFVPALRPPSLQPIYTSFHALQGVWRLEWLSPLRLMSTLSVSLDKAGEGQTCSLCKPFTRGYQSQMRCSSAPMEGIRKDRYSALGLLMDTLLVHYHIPTTCCSFVEFHYLVPLFPRSPLLHPLPPSCPLLKTP
jgi:hypothetical protein